MEKLTVYDTEIAFLHRAIPFREVKLAAEGVRSTGPKLGRDSQSDLPHHKI